MANGPPKSVKRMAVSPAYDDRGSARRRSRERDRRPAAQQLRGNERRGSGHSNYYQQPQRQPRHNGHQDQYERVDNRPREYGYSDQYQRDYNDSRGTSYYDHHQPASSRSSRDDRRNNQQRDGQWIDDRARARAQAQYDLPREVKRRHEDYKESRVSSRGPERVPCSLETGQSRRESGPRDNHGQPGDPAPRKSRHARTGQGYLAPTWRTEKPAADVKSVPPVKAPELAPIVEYSPLEPKGYVDTGRIPVGPHNVAVGSVIMFKSHSEEEDYHMGCSTYCVLHDRCYPADRLRQHFFKHPLIVLRLCKDKKTGEKEALVALVSNASKFSDVGDCVRRIFNPRQMSPEDDDIELEYGGGTMDKPCYVQFMHLYRVKLRLTIPFNVHLWANRLEKSSYLTLSGLLRVRPAQWVDTEWLYQNPDDCDPDWANADFIGMAIKPTMKPSSSTQAPPADVLEVKILETSAKPQETLPIGPRVHVRLHPLCRSDLFGDIPGLNPLVPTVAVAKPTPELAAPAATVQQAAVPVATTSKASAPAPAAALEPSVRGALNSLVLHKG